jgi:hypothetical protein
MHKRFCWGNVKDIGCRENNIAMDPNETGWDDMNGIHLALDRDK